MMNNDTNLLQWLEAWSKIILPVCSLVSIILTVIINRDNRKNAYNVALYTIEHNSETIKLRNRRNLRALILYTKSMLENAKGKDDIKSCLPTEKWFDMVIDSELNQEDLYFLTQWFEQVSLEINFIKIAIVTHSNTVPAIRTKLLSDANKDRLSTIVSNL